MRIMNFSTIILSHSLEKLSKHACCLSDANLKEAGNQHADIDLMEF